MPDLPLQALLRAEPTLAGVPLAVAEGEGARARVLCVSVQARTQAVRPGLSVGDALALCPQLVVRWVPPELVDAARSAVLDAAASVSPKVEELRPGIALVDARGLEKLHGDDRGTASALVAAAARLGLDGTAAVAPGKRIAAIAALRTSGVEVIARGRERAFLAPLPLAALGAGTRIAETLARWGIGTAGELASLPADGIGSRLGEDGARLHALASGRDDEPLSPLQPPSSFEEGADFDYELAAIEGLLFVLRPALERLVDRLECHAMACGGLTLRLLLDPHGEAILPVELAAPTREVPSLLSLCRSVLERRPPGAAVRGVRVIGSGAAPRHEQLRLFGRPTVAPEKLATALAKVAAIVGDDRMGRPILADSHVSDSFTLGRFAPPPPPEDPAERRAPPPGDRRLRPPTPDARETLRPTRSDAARNRMRLVAREDEARYGVAAHEARDGVDADEARDGAAADEAGRGVAAGEVRYGGEPEGASGWDDGKPAGAIAALRLFRPPLPAEVREGRDGPQALRAGAVAGWIVSCAGPWRLDVGWHEAPVCSDAFDVELSDGAVYRLTQDFTTGAWSLVGRYD